MASILSEVSGDFLRGHTLETVTVVAMDLAPSTRSLYSGNTGAEQATSRYLNQWFTGTYMCHQATMS